MLKEQRIKMGTDAYEEVLKIEDVRSCEDSTQYNINQWFSKKGRLIDLLSTHENWSEDDLAIVLPFSEKREPKIKLVWTILTKVLKQLLFRDCYIDRHCGSNEALASFIGFDFEWCLELCAYTSWFGGFNRDGEQLYVNAYNKMPSVPKKYVPELIEEFAREYSMSTDNPIRVKAKFIEAAIMEYLENRESFDNIIRIESANKFIDYFVKQGIITKDNVEEIYNNIRDRHSFVCPEHKDYCSDIISEINVFPYSGSNKTRFLLAKMFSIRQNITPSKTLSKIFKLLDPYFKDRTFNIKDLSCGEVDKEFAIRDGDIISYTYYANFEQFKAVLFDLLVEGITEKKIILSVNPGDFLTQSHGNSWSSCHSFRDRGCYHAGTLSLMADPSSIICYQLKPERSGKLYTYDKLSRVTLYVDIDSGVVLNNQVYPCRCQNEMSKLCRTIVEELISAYHKVENVWSSFKVRELSINDRDNYGYNDYYQQSDEGSSKAFVLKDLNVDERCLTIGGPCKYVDCDTFIDDNEYIVYYEMDGGICEYCGHRTSDDDLYYVEDYGSVCSDCLDLDTFYYCNECGCYYYDPHISGVEIDGNIYCANCARHIDYEEDIIYGRNTSDYFSMLGERFYTTASFKKLFDDYLVENYSNETLYEMVMDARKNGYISSSELEYCLDEL